MATNAADSLDAEQRAVHPLAPLSADEVAMATAIVKADARFSDAARFVSIALHEPPKAAVLGRGEDAVLERCAEIVLYDRAERVTAEVKVSLIDRRTLRWEQRSGVQPSMTGEEIDACEALLKADPRWREALRKRGVDDFSLVSVDPWAAGYGVVPLPERNGNYIPELLADTENHPHVTELRDDMKPLEIRQPHGPSFTVDGHTVRWQKWQLTVGFTPREALVLHDVAYHDQGRLRPILYRGSLSEMYVPYGDPAPMHANKNVFDEGEYGLGFLCNSLQLGCDCLGEIHYFDAVVNNQDGNPVVLDNAICMHEEDYGIAWKHTDFSRFTWRVEEGGSGALTWSPAPCSARDRQAALPAGTANRRPTCVTSDSQASAATCPRGQGPTRANEAAAPQAPE